jgi:hypothetical protein
MKTKKSILTFLLIVTAAVSAFGQNPKREVLFTLGQHEVVESGEYFLEQTIKGNRFACIVEDTVKKEQTFIFNGKRIATTDAYRFNFEYLNVEEENGYVSNYENADKHYINIKGKIYGGYNSIYDIKSYENGEYSFCYKKTDGAYINYKGIEEGPFDNVAIGDDDYDDFASYTKDYDYRYKLAGRWYAHKDGKNKRIDFAESYTDNGKYYANINGNVSGGYEDIYSLQLTESGKYAYYYKDNGKWYANINGNVSSGYEDIYFLQLTENGKYAYRYKDNGKYYANINGNVRGGYESIDEYPLRLTEGGKYMYCYKDNGKYYANINGNVSSGYENIWDIKLSDNGQYSFYYDIGEGKIYENKNGKEVETNFTAPNHYFLAMFYDSRRDGEIEIFSTDKEHSFYSSYKYEYVVIDGKKHGKACSLHAWYDRKKNAFVWNAVEGKELVAYELKLD